MCLVSVGLILPDCLRRDRPGPRQEPVRRRQSELGFPPPNLSLAASSLGQVFFNLQLRDGLTQEGVVRALCKTAHTNTCPSYTRSD